jgi:hypothetical protein
MFSNIPGELRALPQWVVADMTVNPATGQPNKFPINPRTGQMAHVDDPSTWATFEEAVSTGSKYIGFVLSKDDPFCIIDLDNKPHNPASEAEIARHHKILSTFDSYTERSVSGFGYHCIVRGAVPSGIHRDKVEVYSQGRYMITTGNVVHNAPIAERQALLDTLYGEMTPAPVSELVDREGIMDDNEVIEMGMRASNSEKFLLLCQGDFSAYPSQSEADFALMSMFAFYSRDNEQCRRLFRMSKLGKREKATKDNKHLNRMLEKIRAQQPADIDMAQIAANAQAIAAGAKLSPADNPANIAINAPERSTSAANDMARLTLPPGIIGELATHFYNSAIRPVPEIALVSAIALIAGVCARSYNIMGTGLNHYLVLLAKTGTGKEATHSSISKLMSAARPRLPMIDQFIGPSHFASGQAMKRILNQRPCFVSVLGEFGIKLQQITSHTANSAEQMIKAVLLEAFNKSGWTDIFGASEYSDIEKTVAPTQAANITILGESTPESFYDWLDPSRIADGLIPRFSIVEYTGDRPDQNENFGIPCPPVLLQKFTDLVTVAITVTNNNTCCPVQMDAEAKALTDAYNKEADKLIREGGVNAQLWNRAHVKVMKLAALIAVGVNPHAPVINGDAARWAITFVRKEITGVASRFTDGDVGQGDSKQMHDLKHVIELYFTAPPRTVTHDPVAASLQKARIISYRYLIQRTACVASFRNDRQGATAALKRALQAMVDSGIVSEIPIAMLQKNHKYSGVAYGIVGNWR